MSQIVMWPRDKGKADKPGFVYVMQFSSGAVKVGRTANITTRQRQHAFNAEVHGHRIEDVWYRWVLKQKAAERWAIGAATCQEEAKPLGSSFEWWRGADFAKIVADMEWWLAAADSAGVVSLIPAATAEEAA